MSSNDAVGELICPITGEVFLDPVLLVGDGHTYEREAAERWLAKHATSPLSGQPLPPHGLDLVPNHALRKQASALLERRPDLRPVPGAWCAKEDAKGAAGAARGREPLGSRSPGCGGGGGGRGWGGQETRASRGWLLLPRRRLLGLSLRPSPVPRRRFPRGHARRRCAELRPVDARARFAVGAPPRPILATRTRPLPRRVRRRLRLRLGHLQLIHRSHLATPDRHRRLSSRADRRHRARLGDVRGRLPRRRLGRRRGSLRTPRRVPGRRRGRRRGRGRRHRLVRILRADADAPWHKDFVTCVARDGDASVVYGAEDWTLRRADVGAGTAGAVVGALTSVVTAVDVARDAGLIIVGADDGRTFFFDDARGDAPVHAREPDALDHPETSRVAAVAARSDGFGFFVGTPGGAHLLEGPRASFRARADAGGVEKMGSVVAAAAVPGGSGLVVATGGRGLGGRGRPGAWSASWEDGAVVDAAGGAWTEDDAPPTSVVAFEATPLAAATREAAVGDENRPKRGSSRDGSGRDGAEEE